VNLMIGALAVLVAGTITSVVVLWPAGSPVRSPSLAVPKTEGARVTRVGSAQCSAGSLQACQVVTATLTSGRDEGRAATFDFLRTPGGSAIGVGDRIRLFHNPPPEGTPAARRLQPYSFSDFDRRFPLLWLGAAFVVLLLATARLRGLRALVGLGASLVIVLEFAIPSIVHGHSAVAVALTGSLAVLLVTIPLCYGIRAKAIAAWL